MSTAMAVLDIVEWLTSDDCHELDDAGLIASLGRRLRAIDLPIDRLTLHLRTLHPEIFGRSIAWAPGEPVEIHDREHGIELSPSFIIAALMQVMAACQAVTLRLDGSAETAAAVAGIDIYHDRDLAELIIAPLCNTDGPVSAASFGTTRRAGFTVSERSILDRILPALRNACELRTLRQVELTLLDTYTGTNTARRILAGRIRRGQVESLDAALLLCDLRGFTALSNRLPVERVLELLDLYFDRVVPPILAEGGEVLKFIGDAVLAFFPHTPPPQAAAAAFKSAGNALASLARLAVPDATLEAGIALHHGQVSYGNIGSGHRLDFTVIGPDVNLVSRIQSVCGATGHHLLMSARFAGLLGPDRTVPIGTYPLRGFSEPAQIHAVLDGHAFFP